MAASQDQIVGQNEQWTVVQLDRSFKGTRTVVLKVNGDTGAVSLAGDKPVLCGDAVENFAHLGRNGAGAVTITQAKVGDRVIGAVNLTTPGDVNSSFEDVVTTSGQIQQSAATDLSAAQILFTLIHKTPANS